METRERTLGRRGPPLKTALFAACFAALGAGAFAVERLWLDDAGGGGAGEGDAPAGLAFGGAPAAPSDEVTAEVDRAAARVASGAWIAAPYRAIEDPRRAMAAFYRALAGLEAGEAPGVVRAIHYGDSILTTDHLSGRVRAILQQRFGDGGHGFVLLGKPWRWYKHEGVTHAVSGKWRARTITADPLADGMYGLGGVAFQAERQSHGRVRLGPATEGAIGRRLAAVDLAYLEQPRGGSFDVFVDGAVRETVETRAPAPRVVHRTVTVPAGTARVEIEFNNDGELRVFGAALASGDRGVVWDSLAINGARASVLGRYDRAHWIGELRQRDPRLVVLQFGANEGANRFLVLGEYRDDFREVIRTIREALPGASILIVGPMDQAKRLDTGGLGSASMPEKLDAVQREVALAEGCAFFDTWQAMGGRGSMAGWLGKGLGGADLIHPTEHGARKIGTWIAEALLYGYQRFHSPPREDAGAPDAGAVDAGSP